MSNEETKLDGPDLAIGVALSTLADGAMLLGHANGEPVLLARRGDEVFAIGAICTHYGAPLIDGLLVGDTVRCPWHHACFSLRSGALLRPPALKPVDCFQVEQSEGMIFVHGKIETVDSDSVDSKNAIPSSMTPARIVIIGGGAAGNAAAQTLRREGYAGNVTVLSADAAPPYDRPNLSKGFLAGSADEASNPLQPSGFYQQHDIDLKLAAQVIAIDVANRHVELRGGTRHPYDALLLATGAEPVKLDVPGSDLPHVHYLRTLADCHALLAGVLTSKRVVVIGASFIGLEVASSLRARKLEVHVVGRESALMEKVLGAPVGVFLRKLHEEHGVVFHLDATVSAIDARSVTLASGETLAADIVVVGIGVRPVTALAEQAGLAMDRGVAVDAYLETSVPGIFAAGDIARWPDPLTDEHLRVEHWVVAERQGQTAARNMLGRRERFDAVPFFWTEQYDFGLAYVGHAERFDKLEIDGSLDERNCTITYQRDGKLLAEAFVHRDLDGLRAEVAFERTIANTQ
jgi:NADPH-dependent 2,4-dienoyl-CoA reductase/sulfur reductase-like enzyme/nitrite reductase/ring-hydroxylating ferredoxin subunit